MAKRLWVVLAVWALAAGNAAAFETELGFGGHLGFHVGYDYLNLSGVSDYLDPVLDDEFTSGHLGAGGELRGFLFDRLTFGLSGGAFADRAEGPDMEADLVGSLFFFDTGFVVFDARRFRGYPIVGLGAGSVSILLDGDYTTLPLAERAGLENVDLGPEPGDGSAVLARHSDIQLDYYAFCGLIGFNLDWYHPIVGDDRGFLFVMTGLRMGVLGEIASPGWIVEGSDLRGDSPDFAFNSAFVHLLMGFGGGAEGEED